MDDETRVVCRENQCLVDYLLQKKREQVDKPEGLSVNMERTFVKAYRNVCDSKDPFSTLEDLSRIKGFGKWMLTLMKGYFDNGTASSVQKAKERKRYIPQRNSAAYGLLITLHRGTQNVKDFMRKQDLIDATDASGLSHASIAPEKGKGKIGLGLSKREYYSGWSCMTTLIHKGLVIKYSNPAKYKLTVQGREVADECIMRSGLSTNDEMDIAQTHDPLRSKADSSAGTSRAQTCEVDILTDDEMDIAQPYTHPKSKEHFSAGTSSDGYTLTPRSSSSSHACSSSLASGGTDGTINAPRLPPLTFGEKFEEVYQVIMILDDREQIATKGKKIENICSRYEIKIEVRRLPVGDCIWIARHKYLGTEYVLDFIVERKSVDDMRSSIIDGRYRDQKLRLQRSGLRKLIYILEGDPNQSEAAESIKTACFTTEILDGFDVLRSSGLKDTLRNYGDLTKSIHQYYKSLVNGDQNKVVASCPSFDSFVKRCQDLEKMTVSDVFAIQLMQVPQVTEEIAIAVVDMYPTLVSLASAYSNLDGNKPAQEEMLRNRSKNLICATASASVCLMENNSWTNEEIHQHSTYSGNSNMPLKKPELINNTGIAMVWTPEEQTILDNALARYPLDSCVSSCLRYAKISLELPEKTTKDVAMRCRWIKELGRVKVENSISAPHDAVTNELLKQNEQLSEQINANLTSSSSSSSSKLLDNLPLFNQIYENIMELFNKLDENVPDKMKQMPPLREMLNDDLFNLILPHIYLNQHE